MESYKFVTDINHGGNVAEWISVVNDDDELEEAICNYCDLLGMEREEASHYYEIEQL